MSPWKKVTSDNDGRQRPFIAWNSVEVVPCDLGVVIGAVPQFGGGVGGASKASLELHFEMYRCRGCASFYADYRGVMTRRDAGEVHCLRRFSGSLEVSQGRLEHDVVATWR